MRILDDQKRLFGLINPIDLAVLIGLLLVAVVAVRVLFGASSPTIAAEKSPLTMKIVLTKTKGVEASQFEVGGELRKKAGRPIGTITDVEVVPYQAEVATAEGEVVVQESPIFDDVIISVEAEGERTDEGVMIDGSRVRNNMIIDVATPLFEADDARVTELEFVE